MTAITGPAALPPNYAWLAAEGAPKMIVAAVKLYGVHEGLGAADNPQILAWAAEVGAPAAGYVHDATAWCGLFMALVAKRAGKNIPAKPLWALNWVNFGQAVDASTAMLGDVLVFQRRDEHQNLIGGHVGLYVGEDGPAFHVLGGNTADSVSVGRIATHRLHAVRRPIYPRGMPANVRRVELAANGALSTNEV